MTTTVKISAHCSSDKEVHISVSDKLDKVLQDGEVYEVYAYDERVIKVLEVKKPKEE